MRGAEGWHGHGAMNVMKSMVMTAWLLTLAGAAVAQPAPAGPLTLAAAVELAVANHPALRQARAGALAAGADVDVARTAYLPRLDVLWQANRATRNNVFGLLLPQLVIPPVSGPVLDRTSNSVWNSAAGVLFAWDAVDFGRRAASVEQARAEARVAEARQAVSELDVATAAADAYLGVLAAEAVAGAARANVERLTTFAASVRVLVESQLRAGAESSRVEAEVAVARNRLIEAERNEAVARLALADALGLPGAPLTLSPGPLSEPAPFSPALAPNLSAHPRAAAADARRETMRARERVAARSSAPRVEIQSAVSGRGVTESVDGSTAGSGLGLQVPNWAVGVSVAFPSFEVFRMRARQRAEAGRVQEAAAEYDLTLQTLQTQEASAREFVAAAYQVAANTPAQVRAAREGDAQARARYDAGLTTVLEVAEAQRLLADAEADGAIARLAVWRSLLAQATLRGEVTSFVNGAGRVTPAPAR